MDKKALPHNISAERQIIGAMFMDEDACLEALEKLRAEHFHHPPHRILFNALQTITKSEAEVTLTTVAEYLDRNKLLGSAGGVVYLAECAESASTSTQIKSHIAIVLDRYRRRELWRIGEEIKDSVSKPEDSLQLIDRAETQIFSLSNQSSIDTAISADRLASRMTEHIMEMEAIIKSDRIVGVHTGFPTIDRYDHGWKKKQLIICAARPGDGKTALALNMALAAAKSGTPVYFFSIEMSQEEVGSRLIAMISGVDSNHIDYGKLDRCESHEVMRAISYLSNLPLWIDDRVDVTPSYIWSRVRHFKHKHKIGIAFIDYLQKIVPEKSNPNARHREIEDITWSLKELAKTADIPIFCNAQLRRNSDQSRKGPAPRPRLSDLRESGAIEQDAYVVLLIYKTGEEQNETHELIIEKNRTGKTYASIPFDFKKSTQQIKELDRDAHQRSGYDEQG